MASTFFSFLLAVMWAIITGNSTFSASVYVGVAFQTNAFCNYKRVDPLSPKKFQDGR